MSDEDQQPERQKENQSHHSDDSGKSKQKSAMEPPSKPASDSNDGKGRGGSDDHETHIWTERERRKKMRNMFGSLHALLPHLHSKADKSTIVDEAVSYIRTLEQTLQKLQEQKEERLQSVSTTTFGYPYGNNYSREAFIADQGPSIIPTASSNPSIISHYPIVGFQTWFSPNLVLNICGEEAQFSMCSSKKQRLFSSICFVLEKHKIEVLSAHISSDNNRSLYMIEAHAKKDSEAFPMEETFRQAAGEIMLLLS